MATARHNAIAELMNGVCRDRTFTGNEVALMEMQIQLEREERAAIGVVIDTKTKKGRKALCEKIARMINAVGSFKVPITAEHVHMYKKCRADEYTERTGKCSWGYENVCQKFGYDPVTREEIV